MKEENDEIKQATQNNKHLPNDLPQREYTNAKLLFSSIEGSILEHCLQFLHQVKSSQSEIEEMFSFSNLKKRKLNENPQFSILFKDLLKRNDESYEFILGILLTSNFLDIPFLSEVYSKKLSKFFLEKKGEMFLSLPQELRKKVLKFLSAETLLSLQLKALEEVFQPFVLEDQEELWKSCSEICWRYETKKLCMDQFKKNSTLFPFFWKNFFCQQYFQSHSNVSLLNTGMDGSDSRFYIQEMTLSENYGSNFFPLWKIRCLDLFPNLTSLDISNCKLHLIGLKNLFDAISLSYLKLKSLNLSNNLFTSNELYYKLARVLEHSTSLSQLNLSNCCIQDSKNFSILCDGLIQNSSIQYLSLAHNSLQDSNASILAKFLSNSKSLIWLNIQMCSFSSSGLIDILKSLTTLKLQELKLGGNVINDQIIPYLSNLLKFNSNLTNLDIQASNRLTFLTLTSNGYSSLLNTILDRNFYPKMKIIKFGYHNLNSGNFSSSLNKYISNLIEDGIEHISLSHCFLSDTEMKSTFSNLMKYDCVKYYNLHTLNLQDNQLKTEIMELAKFLNHYSCKLTNLNLDNNKFGDKIGSILLNSVSTNTTLVFLSVKNNYLHCQSEQSCVEIFSKNTTLQFLSLSNNRLTFSSNFLLKPNLCNSGIHTLKLADTNLTKQSIPFLIYIISGFKFLKILDLNYNPILEQDFIVLLKIFAGLENKIETLKICGANWTEKENSTFTFFLSQNPYLCNLFISNYLLQEFFQLSSIYVSQQNYQKIAALSSPATQIFLQKSSNHNKETFPSLPLTIHKDKLIGSPVSFSPKVCICRKSRIKSASLIQCTQCCEEYHFDCLNVPVHLIRKDKWICLDCRTLKFEIQK